MSVEESTITTNVTESFPLSEEVVSPDWLVEKKKKINVVDVIVDEWRNESERHKNGFRGIDFCHSKYASVRIIDYILVAPSLSYSADVCNVESNITNYPKLIGAAYFSPKCESHKGLHISLSFLSLS